VDEGLLGFPRIAHAGGCVVCMDLCSVKQRVLGIYLRIDIVSWLY